jgi:mRNA-degrading endonuclease RelE of RelBE toxin-antitoxin system
VKFELVPTKLFLEQAKELSDKAAEIVKNKLILAEKNPFRNKRIKGYNLFLFRIRFEDERKEKRIIYLVEKPKVKILCIIDRDNEYKDLKKFLKKHKL